MIIRLCVCCNEEYDISNCQCRGYCSICANGTCNRCCEGHGAVSQPSLAFDAAQKGVQDGHHSTS